MIGLIIGVFVGGILGVVIMMAAAKGGNEEMILFMTDQQVKHDGNWYLRMQISWANFKGTEECPLSKETSE